MMKFTIKHKITAKDSTNKIYSGMHWAKRKEIVDYWHLLTTQAMRKQLPKYISDKPVMIRISYNSRLDIDNHGWVSKMIIDSIKGYLIVDDTRKHVQCLIQDFHKEKGDIIKVEVTEMI